MNDLSNLDETCRKYLVIPIDDLIRFWGIKGQRSRSQQAVEMVNAFTLTLGASKSIY